MRNEIDPFNFEKINRTRAEFKQAGISISDWARAQGFEPSLVYTILSGRNRGTRGKSHEIALKLGLKTPLEETTVAGLLARPPADAKA
jgi:gp16 family phage-associated protein